MRRTILAGCILSAALAPTIGCDSPVGSMVQGQVEPFTTWTPEAIEADPKGYLRYVGNECDRTIADIEARRIVLRKEKSKLQSALSSAESGSQRLGDQLATYKEAYASADGADSWPASVNGLRLSKAELQRVIVDKNREVETAERSLAEHPSSIARLDNRLADLDVKEGEAREAKRRAREKLDAVEEGEVYASVEEIQFALDDLKAAPESLGDVSPEISLDDVERSSDPSQSEFDAIMAE